MSCGLKGTATSPADAGRSRSAVADPSTSSAAAPVSAALDMGTVRQAMALRVKYRVLTDSGQVKRRMPIQFLGVHPDNRKGVYPQGEVVMSLGMRLADTGFCQEEADHQGVCVEGPPCGMSLREACQNSAVAESYAEYNMSRCRGQEPIEICFSKDSHVVYGTLSHRHLLLVCLSWKNGANWTRSGPTMDLDSAVAENNLRDLHKIIQEGLLMEVLGWQIMKEKPGACALISRALNMGNEAALRTTELSAFSTLSGECALQTRLGNSEHISFAAVAAAVRPQLDCLVDEAEFQDLFEFVINLGAHENPFVPDLIDFGCRFVNQKQRQLRLCAFAEMNKVDRHFPRVKIAALKRSYRRAPWLDGVQCPRPNSPAHLLTSP